MIQKSFRLEESDIEIINETRMQLGIRSEAEALRYITRNYNKEQNRKNGWADALLRVIEEKEDMILDALNTVLIEKGIKICQPVSLRESAVFTKSKEYRKERLANLKERKDYQHRKKGTKPSPNIVEK